MSNTKFYFFRKTHFTQEIFVHFRRCNKLLNKSLKKIIAGSLPNILYIYNLAIYFLGFSSKTNWIKYHLSLNILICLKLISLASWLRKNWALFKCNKLWLTWIIWKWNYMNSNKFSWCSAKCHTCVDHGSRCNSMAVNWNMMSLRICSSGCKTEESKRRARFPSVVIREDVATSWIFTIITVFFFFL